MAKFKNKITLDNKRREQVKRNMQRMRERIRSDPAKYEEYKRKEKERYLQSKKDGKIKSIKDLGNKEKRRVRKLWRERAKKCRESKKAINRVLYDNTPPDSPRSTDNFNIENQVPNLQETPSTSRQAEQENGISPEDVVRDMWIFKYSETYIRNRLQCIKAHRVETVKPWMIRCPEETLYKHIKRESDNKNILGENSVAEYLSERLKCSESLAKYIIRKQPALQTKSLLKMNEMIDFLYKYGFTPSQICRVPKVLLHSTKTANNRITELAALGNKPDSMYVLTKSQKQYIQHVESLIKVMTKAKTV